MEGSVATSCYSRDYASQKLYVAPPDTCNPKSIEEAKATIAVLLREQGQLRLKLEKTERLLNEMSEAYREISEEYFKAKKVALRILNNRGRR